MTQYLQLIVAEPIHPEKLEKLEKAIASMREYGMPDHAIMSTTNYRAGLLLRAHW